MTSVHRQPRPSERRLLTLLSEAEGALEVGELPRGRFAVGPDRFNRATLQGCFGSGWVTDGTDSELIGAPLEITAEGREALSWWPK